MYDITNNIRFCSCDIEDINFRLPPIFIKKKGRLVEKENPKNANIPLECLWTLFKFEGEKEVTELGRFMRPVNELGNGLSSEKVIQKLNNENCFDFEYIAKEGDNLKIHQNYVLSPYLSFIYQKNKWITGYHNPWSTEISIIHEGKIKNSKDKL